METCTTAIKTRAPADVLRPRTKMTTHVASARQDNTRINITKQRAKSAAEEHGPTQSVQTQTRHASRVIQADTLRHRVQLNWTSARSAPKVVTAKTVLQKRAMLAVSANT